MGASHTRKSDTKMNSSSSSSGDQNAGGNHASSNIRPLSIEGPRVSNNSGEVSGQPVANQPRQPTNLQGLLRFAVEATQNESNVSHESHFQPMDEERKQFLSEALKSMTVNIIEELQNAVKILSDVVDLRPDDDPSNHEAALTRIVDYVDSIDIANDFYKIGGFSIFGPCLNSPHSTIRWRTADIIAELAQNNPFCQEKILETELFPTLLGMIDSDPSDAARIKALYAISCIVRGHPNALKYMDVNDGYSVLLRAIQSPVEKLQIKSAFLLSALCNKENSDDLRNTLVNMGLIQQVAGLLTVESLLPETREQVLNVLAGLIKDNFIPALEECRRPEFCLKSTLEECSRQLKAQESFDEEAMCHDLIKKIFSDHDTNQER